MLKNGKVMVLEEKSVIWEERAVPQELRCDVIKIYMKKKTIK